ncbi:type I pantothenate kinase [Tuberibacillus sp. Marseille-P3662]|uniref:type I pantothenate kinase n=1 Tax=Tuberibacillus sp. Marseille-P3662 TaxID=1965358 RepID=UPI000A1CDE7C|nr:type I pantothenate kinase [Tuberibacillus sp. Marseille-P3662]
MNQTQDVSPYMSFTRDEWSQLAKNHAIPLQKKEIKALEGLNVEITPDEVQNIYMPLAQLLNIYVTASKTLHQHTNDFLKKSTEKVPFIIGIAGSVAVGKSTTSRLIKALLERMDERPKVDIITTDGFLYPNAVLERKGIMNRKGFPESFNVKKLIEVLDQLKSGADDVSVPIYSHHQYDVLQNDANVIHKPDIIILEGINVLQLPQNKGGNLPYTFVSDFFDFSIYIDAAEEDIKEWYLHRFSLLRASAFQDPDAYFHAYAALTESEALSQATQIWNEINKKNLRLNILPSRERADLILRKSVNHNVSDIHLRKT